MRPFQKPHFLGTKRVRHPSALMGKPSKLMEHTKACENANHDAKIQTIFSRAKSHA
jgi:hypothetical protein